MITIEGFKNIKDESRKFDILDSMILRIIEEPEYENYSGDDVAAWSEENIIKTFNKIVAKAMLEDVMADIETKKHELRQYFNDQYVDGFLKEANDRLQAAIYWIGAKDE